MEKSYRMFYGNSFSRTPTSAIMYVAPFSISCGGSPRKVFLPTIHICYSSWSHLPCTKTLRNSGVPSAFLGESLRSVSGCVKRMSTVKTGGITLKCLIMNFMFIDAIFLFLQCDVAERVANSIPAHFCKVASQKCIMRMLVGVGIYACLSVLWQFRFGSN